MKGKVELYTRYPWSSILIYNGVTVLHFVLGGLGIMLGYHSLFGYIFGAVYLFFALEEMYVLMPLVVCPNCVYYKLDNSICISGLNVLSRKLVGEGDVNKFVNRAKGPFCSNNLYIASMLIPIVTMIPALIINFSFVVLVILFTVVALLVFRFFVIFSKIACLHCRAKKICPQAQSKKLDA